MSDEDWVKVRPWREREDLYWKLKWLGVPIGLVSLWFLRNLFVTTTQGVGILVSDTTDLVYVEIVWAIGFVTYYTFKRLAIHNSRKAQNYLMEKYKPKA